MHDHPMAVLRDALISIVPFHMAELHERGLTPQNLAAIASRAGKTVGHYGDDLMFSSKPTGRTLSREAQTINALAEGIAAAELLQPGEGVRLLDAISPAVHDATEAPDAR